MVEVRAPDSLGNAQVPVRQVPVRTARVTRVRLAWAYLDIENLLYPYWDGDHEVLEAAFEDIVREVRTYADRVTVVAVGQHSLVRKLVPAAARMGVRARPVCGGPDAADLAIIDRMEHDVPTSCDAVVIGSGDGIFVHSARRQQVNGRYVIALAREGGMSRTLQWVVDLTMMIHEAGPEPSSGVLRP